MPQVRRLGTRSDQEDLYSLSWVKSVEAIEYDATYPAATLRYLDHTLPVAVQSTFFSPYRPVSRSDRFQPSTGSFGTITSRPSAWRPNRCWDARQAISRRSAP